MNGLPKRLRSTKEFKVKKNQILIGPFGFTHSERSELLRLENHDNFSINTQRLSPNSYSRLASEFRFVACPRGNGVDTHRVWETLYRGSVPIVIDNEWSRSLDYLNFPIIRVLAWTESNLLKVVEEFADFLPPQPQNLDFLWIDAWEELFRADFT